MVASINPKGHVMDDFGYPKSVFGGKKQLLAPKKAGSLHRPMFAFLHEAEGLLDFVYIYCTHT